MKGINGLIRRLAGAAMLLSLLQPMPAQQQPGEKSTPPDRQREPYFTDTRPLISLSFSGRELTDHFNRRLNRLRLVVILSSSHREDLRDAAAVARMLERHPKENWSVLAVWTAAKPTDSRASSLLATSVLSDQRVEHFYSASGSMARAFALRLGYPHDRPPHGLFMLFSPGLSWDGLAPQPSFWLHNRTDLQLGKHFSVAELEQQALEVK